MSDLGIPEFAIAIRTAIGLLFLLAAIGKFRNWAVFEGVIANYRLLPEFLVPMVAKALPPVEIVLALALLSGSFSPWPEAVAAVLLLGFALAMGINLQRGRRHIDCGCFQSALKQTLSWSLVARNGVLTLSLLVVWLSPAANLPLLPAIEGLLAGVMLFISLQSLTILSSITPAWIRPPAHRGGAGQ